MSSPTTIRTRIGTQKQHLLRLGEEFSTLLDSLKSENLVLCTYKEWSHCSTPLALVDSGECLESLQATLSRVKVLHNKLSTTVRRATLAQRELCHLDMASYQVMPDRDLALTCHQPSPSLIGEELSSRSQMKTSESFSDTIKALGSTPVSKVATEPPCLTRTTCLGRRRRASLDMPSRSPRRKLFSRSPSPVDQMSGLTGTTQDNTK